MKKIIAFILCSVLLLCSFPVTYAIYKTNVGIEDALIILDELEIIQDYDMTSLDTNAYVTRGEFINYAVRLLGKMTFSVDDTQYYYDVPKSHYAHQSASILTEAGYIRGNGAKMFFPEQDMLMADACKILLSMMNFAMSIEHNGGYPIGCLTTAQSVGLTSGCTGSEYLTTGNMLRMLYNALVCDMNKLTSVSGDGVKYSTTKGVNILSENFDLHKADGRVTSAGHLSIYGSPSHGKDMVSIDDISYIDESGLAYYHIGEEVEFIYSAEEDKDRVIKFMRSIERNILEIDAQNTECTFDSGDFAIKYFEENATKETVQHLSQNITVIHNGEFYTGDIATIFNGFVHEIVLIASDSGDYNIMRITSYENIKVKAIDKDYKKVYGEIGEPFDFDEKSYDRFEIMSSDGVAISFSDIKAGDILSLFVSKNSLTAYISNTTVSGSIEYFDENNATITIDGKEYKAWDSTVVEDLSIHNTVTLYLDAFSYIADVKIGESENFAAFIINAVKENSIDDTVSLKLLNEKGDVKIYKLASRVRLDETTCTSNQAYDLLCPNDVVINQIVICRTNLDGNVNYIDTASEDTDTLRREYENMSLKYYSGGSKFGTKVMVSGNTKIFAVPDDPDIATADDSEFMCKAQTDLSSETYNIDTYRTTDDKGAAEIVVISGYDWGRAGSEQMNFVVKKISLGFNKENIETQVVEGFLGSVPTKLFTANGYSLSDDGVSEGDMVRIKRNSKGELVGCELIYKYGSTELRCDPINTPTIPRIVMGYANSVENTYVNIGYNSGADMDEVFNFDRCSFTLVDMNARNSNERVRAGSINDIVPYDLDVDCSIVSVETNTEYIRHIVIYK